MPFTLETPNENKDVSKILFTGLDNSGKTSIILVLQRKISKIAMLKPTRQAQRKIFEYLGKQIAEWDLGGQKRYRISYLKEPTKYFDNTSLCIYVIDVQDRERMGESLSYFHDVIKQFKKLEISPILYVFFHKMDPDYVKENHVQLEGLIAEVKDKIKKIVKNEFEVSFIEGTTIYDLWTIISAFSQILLRLYPRSELLDKTIEDFAESISAEAILLLDFHSLVIAQYYKNEDAKKILAKSTPYFLTLNDSLSNEEGKTNKMVLQHGSKAYYFRQFFIPSASEPLYLLIMKQEMQFNEESVDAFLSMLKGII